MCPLSESIELLDRVRRAIANADRSSALALLRELAEGGVEASNLPRTLGDALIATASRTTTEDAASAALGRLKRVNEARQQVIGILETAPFGRDDLAAIRAVLESLDAAASAEEERARHEDLVGGQAAQARRVGSVWIEVKYIPDSATGRTYGPYLYARWRESGRKRSRYIGKAGG